MGKYSIIGPRIHDKEKGYFDKNYYPTSEEDLLQAIDKIAEEEIHSSEEKILLLHGHGTYSTNKLNLGVEIHPLKIAEKLLQNLQARRKKQEEYDISEIKRALARVESGDYSEFDAYPSLKQIYLELDKKLYQEYSGKEITFKYQPRIFIDSYSCFSGAGIASKYPEFKNLAESKFRELPENVLICFNSGNYITGAGADGAIKRFQKLYKPEMVEVLADKLALPFTFKIVCKSEKGLEIFKSGAPNIETLDDLSDEKIKSHVAERLKELRKFLKKCGIDVTKIPRNLENLEFDPKNYREGIFFDRAIREESRSKDFFPPADRETIIKKRLEHQTKKMSLLAQTEIDVNSTYSFQAFVSIYKQNNQEVIKALFEQGKVNYNAINRVLKDKSTSPEVAQILKEKIEEDLFNSLATGNIKLLETLLEKGLVTKDTKTKEGSFLVLSARFGQAEMTKFLLQKGCDANETSATFPPLFFVFSDFQTLPNLENAKLLIEKTDQQHLTQVYGIAKARYETLGKVSTEYKKQFEEINAMLEEKMPKPSISPKIEFSAKSELLKSSSTVRFS